jgi:hypothetical protein
MPKPMLHEARCSWACAYDRQRRLERQREAYDRAAKPYLDRMVELRQLYAGPAGDHEGFEMAWTNDVAKLLYEQLEATLALMWERITKDPMNPP